MRPGIPAKSRMGATELVAAALRPRESENVPKRCKIQDSSRDQQARMGPSR